MGILMFVYLGMKESRAMDTEMYQNILDSLQEVLPENWEKLVFYSNYFQGSYSMKYYVKGNDGKYVDCFSMHGVSKEDLMNLFREIDKIIMPVRTKLREKDKWSVLTLTLDKDGRFHAEYDFTDFPEGTITYERGWEKIYLV